MTTPAGARVVCVSPHLDDGVLSMGASLHAFARQGVDVTIATPFAGDPSDLGPSSYWDSKRGDRTGADAARTRRAEDLAACDIVGATPKWADFQDIAYVCNRDPEEVWAFLEPIVSTADAVFVPGWPLANADHRYIASLVAKFGQGLPLGFYAERPYSTTPVIWVKGVVRSMNNPYLTHLCQGRRVAWQGVRLSTQDWLAKDAAVASYTGEVASLGYKMKLAGLAQRAGRGEHIGWPEGTHVPAVMAQLTTVSESTSSTERD